MSCPLEGHPNSDILRLPVSLVAAAAARSRSQQVRGLQPDANALEEPPVRQPKNHVLSTLTSLKLSEKSGEDIQAPVLERAEARPD